MFHIFRTVGRLQLSRKMRTGRTSVILVCFVLTLCNSEEVQKTTENSNSSKPTVTSNIEETASKPEDVSQSSDNKTEHENHHRRKPFEPDIGHHKLKYVCGFAPQISVEPGVNGSKPTLKHELGPVCCSGAVKNHKGHCVPHCEGGCGEGVCVRPGLCNCENNRCSFLKDSKTCTRCPTCPNGCPHGTCIANNTCQCNPGYRAADEWTRRHLNNTNITGGCVPYCFPFCSNMFFTTVDNCICDYSSGDEDDSNSIEFGLGGKKRKSKKRLHKYFKEHGHPGFTTGLGLGAFAGSQFNNKHKGFGSDIYSYTPSSGYSYGFPQYIGPAAPYGNNYGTGGHGNGFSNHGNMYGTGGHGTGISGYGSGGYYGHGNGVSNYGTGGHGTGVSNSYGTGNIYGSSVPGFNPNTSSNSVASRNGWNVGSGTSHSTGNNYEWNFPGLNSSSSSNTASSGHWWNNGHTNTSSDIGGRHGFGISHNWNHLGHSNTGGGWVIPGNTGSSGSNTGWVTHGNIGSSGSNRGGGWVIPGNTGSGGSNPGGGWVISGNTGSSGTNRVSGNNIGWVVPGSLGSSGIGTGSHSSNSHNSGIGSNWGSVSSSNWGTGSSGYGTGSNWGTSGSSNSGSGSSSHSSNSHSSSSHSSSSHSSSSSGGSRGSGRGGGGGRGRG